KYGNFRGLLIEEIVASELYPLATVVFFDGGSAEIPDRYVTMTDPTRIAEFTDTTIPGGTFQKYYHLLNIIGYRMRRYPATRITVTGCNSAEPGAGENREISVKRGESIVNYLTGIWGIDRSRITMASRNLPEIPSDQHDSLGIAENRRVEITSPDWDITKPVVNTDSRRFPQPDTMHFQMKNGVPDSLVASREIEITWEGKPWHVMRTIGIANPVSPAYSWARNDNPDPGRDDRPSRSTPYSAWLTIHLRNGSVMHSSEVTIPVLVITSIDLQAFMDTVRFLYTPILFGFRRANLTAFNQRVFKEYIDPNIGTSGGVVDVLGFADAMETGTGGPRLSADRAKSVAADIRGVVKKSSHITVRDRGLEAQEMIYPNELPEGRFYNRTVQVRIDRANNQAD
ncbi:MAG: hypothetical protein ABI876_18920, partial [Bacteroidota bacterium]